MLQKLQKRNESGFTIIEVLIVLAIAGLILLIVFLAVPALQRNSRNNGRKNDSARVASELANFASNNNGTLAGLTTNTWDTGLTPDCPTILKDVGNLSEFGGTACSTSAATTMPGNVFQEKVVAAAITITGPASGKEGWVYATSATCGTTSGNKQALKVGTSRQSALVYTIETSGVPDLTCLSVT